MNSMSDILNRTEKQMESGNGQVAPALAALIVGLGRLRNEWNPDDWKSRLREIASHHPVNNLLRQDPFTHRAYEKPRGYAGDAVMIDYIYGRKDSNGATALGKTILEHLRGTALSNAVRWRRDTLTAAIDDCASRTASSRILALACGHLREGHASNALPTGRLGEFVALDHDPESLAVVEREFGGCGVKRVQASIFDIVNEEPPPSLLAPKGQQEGFDLVYAAGLFDYLWQGAGEELTAWCFRRLRPGGRLLIANLLPNLPEAAYMEAITDWWLVYRTEKEMADLASRIPEHEIRSKNVFKDQADCVAFLDIVRA